MKERPILFSGPMVRAIMADEKTQTRRVITLPKWAEAGQEYEFEIDDKPGQGQSAQDWPFGIAKKSGCLAAIPCPYGEPGDRLWVRETWAMNIPPSGAIYRADGWGYGDPIKWRPSIFMPRWASRITLEVGRVRVERVQSISEEDAFAEGISRHTLSASYTGTAHKAYGRGKLEYRSLWNSINEKRGKGWDKNPWVWAITFRRLP